MENMRSGSLHGATAAALVQQLNLLPEFKADTFSALPRRKIGHVRLGYPDFFSKLVLRKSGVQEVGDEFFPHGDNNSKCCCVSQQQALLQQVLSNGYRGGMELSEIRRRRLQQWINEDPASKGVVEAWCAHYSKQAGDDASSFNPIYIRQIVPPKGGPARRNLGEKAARKLERVGGKPAGWLDAVDTHVDTLVVQSSADAQSSQVQATGRSSINANDGYGPPVTNEEAALLRDLRELLPDRRAHYAEQIRLEANVARAYKAMGHPPAVSDERVSQFIGPAPAVPPVERRRASDRRRVFSSTNDGHPSSSRSKRYGAK